MKFLQKDYSVIIVALIPLGACWLYDRGCISVGCWAAVASVLHGTGHWICADLRDATTLLLHNWKHSAINEWSFVASRGWVQFCLAGHNQKVWCAPRPQKNVDTIPLKNLVTSRPNWHHVSCLCLADEPILNILRPIDSQIVLLVMN